ncbi:MAG: hypothetical protein RL213_2119 [Bacteroidota bacterium]
MIDRSGLGASTDPDGNAFIPGVPAGNHIVSFRLVGYTTKSVDINFIDGERTMTAILLASVQTELEEVVVSTTRTNSRIEDLNTKVEVLGLEEMNEESELVPGSITSILGDLSVITIQRTNAVNGNEAIRLQGLDPRYTQLMKDGIPLYGGFSGSLGVLSIPPLDLKQVEIIKGSASTLYGGGAIGGLINFISKEPVDSSQHIVSQNYTTQNEYNANSFFSGKTGKFGYTIFAGYNSKAAYDVNKDGFAEVPLHNNITLHPRLFYSISDKTILKFGWNSSFDHRAGGDLRAIRDGADSLHPYLQTEQGNRHTADLEFSSPLGEKQLLTIKSAVSSFDRNIHQPSFYFNGRQRSDYVEVNDLLHLGNHTVVVGGNFISENFKRPDIDSSYISPYHYTTVGAFAQDDWQLTSHLSLQSGLRFDHHNVYGNRLLPRISLLYKATHQLSVRLASGAGYKAPNVFDLSDPSSSLRFDDNNVRAEQSYGINADINYHVLLSDKFGLQVDQAFYYTKIDHPTMLVTDASGEQRPVNAGSHINSYGTDTYVRLMYNGLECYLGYNHTEAKQDSGAASTHVAFNPNDKFSTTLTYSVEGVWRTGIEAAWNGRQFLPGDVRVPNYWFMAMMVQRNIGDFSIVLNCENLLDERQSKFGPLVTGNVESPVFLPVWGPIEGRVFNLSVKYSW